MEGSRKAALQKHAWDSRGATGEAPLVWSCLPQEKGYKHTNISRCVWRRAAWDGMEAGEPCGVWEKAPGGGWLADP